MVDHLEHRRALVYLQKNGKNIMDKDAFVTVFTAVAFFMSPYCLNNGTAISGEVSTAVIIPGITPPPKKAPPVTAAFVYVPTFIPLALSISVMA